MAPKTRGYIRIGIRKQLGIRRIPGEFYSTVSTNVLMHDERIALCITRPCKLAYK